RITSIRFTRVVDEWGNAIRATHEPKVQEFYHDPRGRPVWVDDFQMGALATAGDGRADNVQLHMSDKPTRSLKHLAGSILAEVFVTDTIAAVADVNKAIGKKVQGDRGATLTVHELVREEDGTVAVRLNAEAAR